MPFAPINVKEEIERQRNISPEFRKAWDESRAEYKLVGIMSSPDSVCGILPVSVRFVF